MTKFSEEVKRVGELKKELERQVLAPKVVSSKIPVVPSKLMKPPDPALFSGVEPLPKDEGSFDQWLFQVREAMESHCKEAVRSVILRSVRGKAGELIRFIGFRANLDTILIGTEERFGRGPKQINFSRSTISFSRKRVKGYNSLPVDWKPNIESWKKNVQTDMITSI